MFFRRSTNVSCVIFYICFLNNVAVRVLNIVPTTPLDDFGISTPDCAPEWSVIQYWHPDWTHKVSQGLTRSHKVPQGPTRSHKASKGLTRTHKVSQGPSECGAETIILRPWLESWLASPVGQVQWYIYIYIYIYIYFWVSFAHHRAIA